jgi:N utilization substance protein B
MAQRHKAREYALQMAFQWEIGRQNVARIEEGFWRMVRGDKNMRALANQLFEGTVAASTELEALVGKHAQNWRVERMSVMDRVILKLAAWELRAGKTPPKVVLNEALELAKTFSSGESAAFINGVLDAMLKAQPPAQAQPQPQK